jgi:DNA transformation protein and related proteins
MPVSESYKLYVIEQLELAGSISAKAMFGGVGLYCEGFFFGLIADDTLFKVDDSNRPAFEAIGSRPFQPFGEGSYSMSYYEVPADILEDRAAIGEWVGNALAVARKRATARKKRRKY